MNTEKRPQGIETIGFYYKWFSGVLLGLLAVGFLLLSFLPIFFKAWSTSIRDYQVMACLGILLSIGKFILGNGILSLKAWGRRGILYYNIFTVLRVILIATIWSMLGAISLDLRMVFRNLVALSLPSIIIFYLVRSKSKEICVKKGFDGIRWF